MLVQRLRLYLEPPACRVPLATASIAFLSGHAVKCCLMTASGQRSQASVDVASRFSVQSITKSFTAAVIVRLAAAGKLRLDAPLSEWLSDVPNANRVTIRQCLQHTSGLPDYGSLPEYHKAIQHGEPPWTFTQFLSRTHAEHLLFEPGTGWRYSNIAYMLLRRLIEAVSGQTFAESVAAEVCQPLGLRSTSVIQSRDDFQALAPAYTFTASSDGLPVDVRATYDPGWVAPGVVASTATDIVRFYDRLFAGDLLPGPLLEEMRKVVRTGEPSMQRFVAPSYGLGLMADPRSPYGVLFGHNGGGPGFTSSAFHVVSPRGQAVTVAVLSNIENPFEVELMAWTILHALMTESRSAGA